MEQLGLLVLIYLYNLLVPEITKWPAEASKPKQPPVELKTLLHKTNEALATFGPGSWFYCRKEGCDHRPYYLKHSELADAEGVIACEVCGELCYRVSEEALQRTFLM
ncbi:MAG: hypothetical protein HS114_34575 [Anaerolineales bacterium]|nr:hypothetical protein [Anaerolineales bacterium]